MRHGIGNGDHKTRRNLVLLTAARENQVLNHQVASFERIEYGNSHHCLQGWEWRIESDKEKPRKRQIGITPLLACWKIMFAVLFEAGPKDILG